MCILDLPTLGETANWLARLITNDVDSLTNNQQAALIVGVLPVALVTYVALTIIWQIGKIVKETFTRSLDGLVAVVTVPLSLVGWNKAWIVDPETARNNLLAVTGLPRGIVKPLALIFMSKQNYHRHFGARATRTLSRGMSSFAKNHIVVKYNPTDSIWKRHIATRVSAFARGILVGIASLADTALVGGAAFAIATSLSGTGFVLPVFAALGIYSPTRKYAFLAALNCLVPLNIAYTTAKKVLHPSWK